MSTMHTRPRPASRNPLLNRATPANSGAAKTDNKPALAASEYTVYAGDDALPARMSTAHAGGRTANYDAPFGAFGPLGREIQSLPSFEENPNAFLELPFPFKPAEDCTNDEAQRRKRWFNNVRSCTYAVNKAIKRKSRELMNRDSHDRLFSCYQSDRNSVVICRKD